MFRSPTRRRKPGQAREGVALSCPKQLHELTARDHALGLQFHAEAVDNGDCDILMAEHRMAGSAVAVHPDIMAGSISNIGGAETQPTPEYLLDSFSGDGLHTHTSRHGTVLQRVNCAIPISVGIGAKALNEWKTKTQPTV